MKRIMGFLGLALGILLGSPLQAQPSPQPGANNGSTARPADNLQETVGVLDLDADPGVKLGLLQGNFLQVAEEEIAVNTISGDKLSSLVTLYGCEGSSSDCLLQVASGLSAKWLVYGYVTQKGEGLHLKANLFSATEGKNVSSVEADFVSPADSTTLRAALRQLLSSAKFLLKEKEEVAASGSGERAGGVLRWVFPGVLAAGGAASGVGALLLDQKRKNGGVEDPAARTQLQLLSVGADVLLTSSVVWFVISLATNKKSASANPIESVVLSE